MENKIEKEKKSLRQTMASKSLKAGMYSLAVCAVALVIVVLINMITSSLPARIVHPDISKNGIYTLSEHSINTVKAIQDDVTIYHLTTHAARDDRLASLLERYAELNKHVHVEEKDPQISQIASKYTKDDLSDNSLIIVSDKRNRVVEYSSIMKMSEQMQWYAYYYGEENTFYDDFCGEREVTSAIDFVTKDVFPKVYVLTGHDEIGLESEAQSEIEYENFEIETLDLVQEKTIPEDCACLMIISPMTDLLDMELEEIQSYFANGGKLFVTTYPRNYLEKDVPNFDKLLRDLGIVYGEGRVNEGDENAIYETLTENYQIMTCLIPTLNEHEITTPILDKNYHVFCPGVSEMRIADNLRSTLDVQPLMHTTNASYSRTDPDIQSAQKTDADVAGPFDIAYAVRESSGSTTGQAIVVATSFFMNKNLLGSSGNVSFLINSLKWMNDPDGKVDVIEGKSLLNSGSLEISEASATGWSALLVALIPFAILTAGVVVFIWRKKR